MRHLKSVLIAAATAALLASAAVAQQKTTYSYDIHGQLVTAKRIEAEATYAYDPASNRTALGYRRLYPILQSWEAEEIAWHQVGHADGDGWSADPATADGLLTYGPYATNTPVGDNVAVWKLTRGASALPASQPVVVLSVFDSTNGTRSPAGPSPWPTGPSPRSRSISPFRSPCRPRARGITWSSTPATSRRPPSSSTGSAWPCPPRSGPRPARRRPAGRLKGRPSAILSASPKGMAGPPAPPAPPAS